MTRRRALLARVESDPGIDTSPRIAEYDKRYSMDGSIIESSGKCYTDIYNITPNNRVFRAFGIVPSTINYVDGVYNDYWNITAIDAEYNGPLAKNVANEIAFTIQTSLVDDSYVIQVGTGSIVFAGRNTPYYGYTNINDMPTGT